MIYLLYALATVAVVAITIFLMVKPFDSDYGFNKFWSSAFLVWVVVLIAAGFYANDRQESKGPCLEYKTSMHWNPSTKTMMPMRVCAVRGEWVKP